MEQNKVTHIIPANRQSRQGDVFVEPVTRTVDESDIGTELMATDNRRLVLALGEATGHAHAFYGAEAPLIVKQKPKNARLYAITHPERYSTIDVSTDEGRKVAATARLLRLETTAFLRHEEHEGHAIPAGDYIVTQPVEFDESNELRVQAD